jgi:hypothetical protein
MTEIQLSVPTARIVAGTPFARLVGTNFDIPGFANRKRHRRR